MLINELFEVESDAVVFYGENGSKVSLHDFQAASEIVAYSLKEKGVRRASIVTDDACWFAIALLACWIAGIEPVVPGLAGAQLMTREKARYGTILSRSQRKFRYGPGTLAIDELVRGSHRIPFHHLDEKLEYSVFTSGSTGEPKEIRRSLGEVCAEASSVISHFNPVFDQTDCFASTVPCRHSFGLMFRVFVPMFVAGLVMMVNGWIVPEPCFSLLQTIGRCNTAISMLVIGMILSDINPKELVDKIVVRYTVERLILIPLLVWIVLLPLVNARILSRFSVNLSVLLAAMPAGATTSMLAAKYECAPGFATRMVILSTLCSIPTIFLWSMVLA